MAFHEVLFPEDISYGSRGGPGFRTSVSESDSGHERRVSHWSRPRYSFDVSYGVRTQQQLYTLREFYNARLGVANGFRFKDPVDYATTSTGQSTATSVITNADVLIGTGDGSEVNFQLIKRYTSGANTVLRIINKPVTGTYKLSVNDVDQGSEGSGWSINESTGVLTFDVAPTDTHAIKAGFEFDVPVRFGDSVDAVLSTSVDAFQLGSAGRIPILEIVDENEQPEDVAFLGAKNHGTLSADVSIALSEGQVHRFDPDATRIVTLPNAATMPAGGWHFHLINVHATNDITVKGDGVTINTLQNLKAAIYAVGLDAAGDKKWYALSA